MNTHAVNEKDKLTTGILGYGNIGSQLVSLNLVKGIDSVVLVRNPERFNVTQLQEKNELNNVDLRFTSTINDLSHLDMVVEALPEKLDVKVNLIKELLRCGFKGVVCSTTSTFPISEFVEAGVPASQIYLLHFSNPVQAFPVVEVIDATQLEIVNQLVVNRYLSRIGYKSFLVPDTKGYVINRVYFPMLFEALRSHCEDNVPRGTIDELMKSACGLRMGPIDVIEKVIGKRTTLSVLESLYGEISSEVYRFLTS